MNAMNLTFLYKSALLKTTEFQFSFHVYKPIKYGYRPLNIVGEFCNSINFEITSFLEKSTRLFVTQVGSKTIWFTAHAGS